MDQHGDDRSPRGGATRADSAGAAVADGTAASQRGAIDQRRILEAAIEFIDEKGLRKLTMRALGTRLGVEAMSLYHYVPSKDSLLDGVVAPSKRPYPAACASVRNSSGMLRGP